ncbi:T9SS type A sorting domain-containing protein [bacterium]|nr:T9SS type A sorting domain-containing protein [bacterium]
MKKKTVWIISILLLFVVNLTALDVGDAAEDFTSIDPSGTTYYLSQYKGQVVLLFALGNTCHYCIAEGQYVEALYQEFADNGQFAALGLDFWDASSSVTSVNYFIHMTGISFPILMKVGFLSTVYDITYDRLMVVAPNGIIAFKGNLFASQDIDAARQVIKSLLQTTRVSDNLNTPATFRLDQNVPNPFNPSTRIVYSIPENAMVRLTIFNQMGQEIATLVDEVQQQGEHSVIFERSGIPSGVYFYRLNIGNQFITKKMMILR